MARRALAGAAIARTLHTALAECSLPDHDASKCCEYPIIAHDECTRDEVYKRDCCRVPNKSGCLDGYVYSTGDRCTILGDKEICCVPPPRDCAGSWSACTSACETAGERSWTETASRYSSGAPCPAAQACQPGEGACPSSCTGIGAPAHGSLNGCPSTLAHGASCVKACDSGYTLTGAQPSCDDGTLTDTVECTEDVDCVGSWSGCTSACARTWTETAARNGAGAACPPAPSCSAGEDDCPPNIDCAGTWSDCSSECVWSTWTETVAQSGQGAVCPSAPSCPAGEDDCPPDIDCAGSWSACTSACARTWTETAAQSGQGSACPSAAPSCSAGEDDCPPNIDCAGTWSDCSSECVWSTWTETAAQSGQGAVCPSAPSCPAGEGDCPPDIDCAGSWGGTCTRECVWSAFSETVAQSGHGAACPPSPPCPAGEGDCPHTCSSAKTSCIWDCDASGDYGDCSLQTPVVRDCVVQNEMSHCLTPEKTSAANHACASNSLFYPSG